MESETGFENEKEASNEAIFDEATSDSSNYTALAAQPANGETQGYGNEEPQVDASQLISDQLPSTQENIGMVSIGHIDETSGLQGEVEEERMDEDVDPEDDTESSEVSAKGPEENSEGTNKATEVGNSVQEVVREVIPDVPDDEYFASLDKEDIESYKKVAITFETNIHCTTCFRQVTYEIGGMTGIVRHPILGVVVCKQCKVFYVDNDWAKDDDGCDMFCRWCAEGGELILCDNCTSSFCRRCLQRNMGREYITEITSSDTWKCLRCNPRQLDDLRALYYHIYINQEELKDRPLTSIKSEAIQRIEREMEEMPENFIDESLVKAFYALKEYEKIMEDERARWVIANRELEIEVATGITRRLRKIYAITKQKMDQLDKDIVTSFVKSFPTESTRIHMGEIEPVLPSDDEDLAPLSAPKSRKLATLAKRKSVLKKLPYVKKSKGVQPLYQQSQFRSYL